jgi:hypothetical protein
VEFELFVLRSDRGMMHIVEPTKSVLGMLGGEFRAAMTWFGREEKSRWNNYMAFGRRVSGSYLIGRLR